MNSEHQCKIWSFHSDWHEYNEIIPASNLVSMVWSTSILVTVWSTSILVTVSGSI